MLEASIIASIKESIKHDIKEDIGNITYYTPAPYLDNGDGTYSQGEAVPRTTLNFENLDRVIDIIVDQICIQLSDKIVSHFKQHAEINITTGILGNGGATAGYGGPAIAVMITGTCAVPNTIT